MSNESLSVIRFDHHLAIDEYGNRIFECPFCGKQTKLNQRLEVYQNCEHYQSVDNMIYTIFKKDNYLCQGN